MKRTDASLTMARATNKLIRWHLRFAEFDFNNGHIARTKNQGRDGLSHLKIRAGHKTPLDDEVPVLVIIKEFLACAEMTEISKLAPTEKLKSPFFVLCLKYPYLWDLRIMERRKYRRSPSSSGRNPPTRTALPLSWPPGKRRLFSRSTAEKSERYYLLRRHISANSSQPLRPIFSTSALIPFSLSALVNALYTIPWRRSWTGHIRPKKSSLPYVTGFSAWRTVRMVRNSSSNVHSWKVQWNILVWTFSNPYQRPRKETNLCRDEGLTR